MPTKDYELHLGYFKQGDDLAHAIKNTKTGEEALEYHAKMLESAAAELRKIIEATSGEIDIIQADTHFIMLSCDSEVGDRLVREMTLSDCMDCDEPDDLDS